MKIFGFQSLVLLAFAIFAMAQVFAESQKDAKVTVLKKSVEENWGPVVNGLQLSFRLPTNIFVIGEPIKASMTLRNTTTNRVALYWRIVDEFHFVITRGGGPPLAFTNHMPAFISGPSGFAIEAKKQMDYSIDITQDYNLSKAGEYEIRATRPLSIHEANPPATITSAPLKIKIVASKP